ncbi:MAG: histidine phosphatase family protein [Defluviitaleaceae bacterium]|nr:histidine phosphatase family protein [Defluviitaleaceae bacterium]
MDLLIIRHGQSEADILNVNEGRADFALTKHGQNQAAQMAKWVSNYMKIEKIYASTLKRARQTAEKLSAHTSISIQFEDALMEWNNGLIAGLSREEANKLYPAPMVKFPHTAMYEQESDIEFRARAEAIFSKIINENPPGSKIVIVSHGGMISRLFQSFMGLPMVSDVSIYSGDTGVHHWQIDINAKTKRIIFLNSLVHLKELV